MNYLLKSMEMLLLILVASPFEFRKGVAWLKTEHDVLQSHSVTLAATLFS